MSKIENVGNLMAAELDEVSGGRFDAASVALGLVAGSAGPLLIGLYTLGAFDSVVEWKDGKLVFLGVPQ